LEDLAWLVHDMLVGVVKGFAKKVGSRTKSAPWWSPVLATARDLDPTVYVDCARSSGLAIIKKRLLRLRLPRNGAAFYAGGMARWTTDLQ